MSWRSQHSALMMMRSILPSFSRIIFSMFSFRLKFLSRLELISNPGLLPSKMAARDSFTLVRKRSPSLLRRAPSLMRTLFFPSSDFVSLSLKSSVLLLVALAVARVGLGLKLSAVSSNRSWLSGGEGVCFFLSRNISFLISACL